MLSRKKHRGSLGRNLATLLVLGILAAAAGADDWPQWLGPRRDGVWRESGIVESFPAGGPEIKWRIPVGPGYSGPAVAGGRVYLTDRQPPDKKVDSADATKRGIIPGKERILCLD